MCTDIGMHWNGRYLITREISSRQSWIDRAPRKTKSVGSDKGYYVLIYLLSYPVAINTADFFRDTSVGPVVKAVTMTS